MERQGFVEVETPMLMASTPEGAREFLVPSRHSPGSFYVLPQSPQLFKQLLMVGGIDRYYQIARCLRDEDFRADRQYEFMQFDAEASFVDQDDVMAFINEAVLDAAEAIVGERPPVIDEMTWHDAMDRYGVDKPDLRFEMQLVELTSIFAGTEFKAFAGAASIKGIRVPGGGATTRNQLDALTDKAKSLGAKGLVWMRVGDGLALESPVAKFVSESEQQALVAALAVEAGDLILIVADEWMTACEVLGTLRNDLGRPPVYEGPYRYVWIVDFPMFVGVSEDGHPKPAHHPFTLSSSRRHRPTRERPDVGTQPRGTTSCSTDGSSAADRSGSTSPTCSSASSTCSASEPRRPPLGSASSSRRSATARRPTAVSRSASTGSSRSSRAKRTSVR